MPPSLGLECGCLTQNKDPFEKRLATFLESLENLGPGTWLLVEHPGLDTPEMQAHGHPGCENVAQHRRDVTPLFTDPRVKEAIQRRGIELISYGQLKHTNPKRERGQ